MAFQNDLILRSIDQAGKWRLHEPLIYDNGSQRFIVPKEFLTDLATIPAGLRGLISVNGQHRKAAVLHDYLYSADSPIKDRKEADLIFLEAMKECGVSWIIRNAMYRAVRVFGGAYWKGDRT